MTRDELVNLLAFKSPRFTNKCLEQAKFLIDVYEYTNKTEAIWDAYNILKGKKKTISRQLKSIKGLDHDTSRL